MAYSVINKTGCCERKGHPQIRFDMFLEPDDARYEETYIQVPVIPVGGYPNKTNKDGTHTDQKGYDLWYASLPRIWQHNPFHSHFIGYYPHDFTDSQLKSDMDFHLNNFYKAYQDGWDAVKGGMRHGYAVEKRIIPVNYAKTLEVVEYKAIQSQVINRLNRLDEFKQTPIKLDDGKSYPATTIDIGDEATNRNGTFTSNYTIVTVNNPANDTGILDTVETWFFSNATGFKVGTFSGSGTSYDDRDYETIGAVTSGSKQTFTGLSIDVVTGDFIGCYYATGHIDISTSGYTAVYITSGDKFGTGSAVYGIRADDAISLYATGETLPADVTVTPTTLSLTTTSYAPTVTKTENKTATPTTLSLSITSYAPTVTKTENVLVTPTTAELTITTYAPNIIGTGNKTVTPTTLSLAITTYAPIAGYDIDLIPTTLSLSITTYVPTVTISASKYVEPSTLELAITGYAPTITIREIPASALKYTLEVRNSSGNLVSILENAFDRTYTEKINEPQQLTFSIPASDSKVSGLVKPNQIWLRDYSTGTLIRKFVITRLVKKDSGNCTYQVECKGYLSKLLKAVVQSYSPSGKTPTEILTALLAYQTLDTITLGTVDITGTYSFSWSNTTVLACLNDCLNVWGGYFDVDNDNELTWLDDIGSDVGQQIRYRKNLIDVEEETDYEGQNGRLYPSGSGGIVLSDKSMTMEVADQSEDATYGYLTVPTDYVCFDEASLEVLRKGTKEDLAAFDIVANVPPWIDWNVVQYPNGYAVWTVGAGNDISTPLGMGYNVAKYISGLRLYLNVSQSPTITRIVVKYTLDTFTTLITAYDSGTTLSYTAGYHTIDIDFGQRFYCNGIALYVYCSTPIGQSGTVSVDYQGGSITKGTIDLFDESSSWTNINDRQLSIPIASYESEDTYYLSYDLADYLKDLTAISTYGDEGIQMQFSYAADVDTLLAYAIAQLEMINDPPKSYSGNILYLDEISTNFSFDELDLGNIVDLIHEPLGIEDSVRVVGMSKNLDNPSTGSIEIVRKAKSLAEAFKAIYGRL